MKSVTLVIGATGEYDDKAEWIVCGFEDSKKAVRFAERLNSEIQRVLGDFKDYGAAANNPEVRTAVQEQLRKIDPYARIDYTGIRYHTENVAVIDKAPIVKLTGAS